MGARKKKKTVLVKEKYEDSWKVNASVPARNLTKHELGAIIFGCKHSTIKECLEKEIFGLPAGHYPMVNKATSGLTLFLFNYSDRKLHGIFEAVSSGGMNINPHAWITSREGLETTPYPAQVRVRARCRCRPLLEEQIKPIIANNYYTDKFFWFELDKEQTKGLMTLFQSSPWPDKIRSPLNANRKNNTFDGLSSSSVIKTADDEFKDVDSKEPCGMAQARVYEKHYSNAPVVCNPSAFYPGKKWNELFKSSSSSSVVNNAEVLECQEELNQSTSECVDVEWESTSNLNAWSALPSEACNGVANAESDSDVVECWEDSELLDDYVKEIFETNVQYQNGESSSSEPYFPSLENMASYEGWGDLKPSEFDSVKAEEHGEDLVYSEAHNESDITLAPAVDCGRDGNQLNLIETKVQGANRFLSEGVLMNAESSNFLYVVTKFMQEIEELKAMQFNQNLRIESLEYELVESKQEIDELKKRFQNMECLTFSSRD